MLRYFVFSCLFLQTPALSVPRRINETYYEITTEKIDKVEDYGWHVWCKLQPNGYVCRGKYAISRFYYDLKMEDCKTAIVGGCTNNLNSFGTLSDCQASCRDDGEHAITENMTARVFCRLQPDFGKCNSYYPMWYFDMTHRECRGFSWSGCGGNMNRFQTSQLCASICMSSIQYE